jgi:hypothetical protein
VLAKLKDFPAMRDIETNFIGQVKTSRPSIFWYQSSDAILEQFVTMGGKLTKQDRESITNNANTTNSKQVKSFMSMNKKPTKPSANPLKDTKAEYLNSILCQSKINLQVKGERLFVSLFDD